MGLSLRPDRRPACDPRPACFAVHVGVGKGLTVSGLRIPAAILEGPLTETERRYAENLKFSSCLADSFLRASVRVRLFDSVGAEQVVALPAVQHA